MKKIIYGGICFISGILITLMVVNYNSIDETIYDNTNALKTSSSSIAMMLETDLDSDEYFLSTDTSWPDSSSYSFNSTLSKCENGSTLSWDGENNQVLMTGNTSDKCYIYFDYTPVFSEYIISLYTEDGENSLYYHDGVGTYTNADLDAGDYSYRYSGASDEVSNYVCFGSNSEICEDDNLYRIIGVFKNDEGDYEVKLIKYDYANSDLLGTDGDYSSEIYDAGDYSNYLGSHSTIDKYYWNGINSSIAYSTTGYYDNWSYSALNTVNLNTNYYNKLDGEWQNMIITHTWIAGGNTYSNIYSVTANNVYNNELVNYVTTEVTPTYTANVGLIYVSDYAYATDPTYWSVATFNYDSEAYQHDWMYMGLTEWTISRASTVTIYAFYVFHKGCVYVAYGDVYDASAIRPTFYLSSSVIVTSGSGSYESPYRLKLAS